MLTIVMYTELINYKSKENKMSNTAAEKENNTKIENPLITVEGFKLKKLSVITTFSDETKINKAIDKFRTEALSVVPDLSTKKGRDVIASTAFKVSKKKTSIIKEMIDPSIEDAKKLVKNVNDGKKHFQNKMDALRDEVRKPLTEWEEAEKIKENKRIESIKKRIAGIASIVNFNSINKPSKDEITSLLEAVESINCNEGFDEFTQDALQAKSRAKEVLTEELNSIIQQELKDSADEELRLKEIEIEKQQIKQKSQERVNNLMMIPVGFFGKSSKEIESKIKSLTNYKVEKSEFGDLYETAKTSVDNAVIQLKGMLQQQLLVEEVKLKTESETKEKQAIEQLHQEQAQTPQPTAEDALSEAIATDEKPINERLGDKFSDIETTQRSRKIPGGHEVSIKLTPHQSMLREVEFWAKEYGIVNSEYTDLINILKKYK